MSSPHTDQTNTTLPIPAVLARDIGTVHLSKWHTISQAQVAQHAATTGDGEHEWLHLDPVRATQEQGLSGTIVQGFLQVAHLVRLCSEAMQGSSYIDSNYGLNYGFDKLRFINPLPTGALFRAQVVRESVTAKGNAGFLVKQAVNLHLEDGTITMVADWLFLLQPGALNGKETRT
jgi:acyl dehydratase